MKFATTIAMTIAAANAYINEYHYGLKNQNAYVPSMSSSNVDPRYLADTRYPKQRSYNYGHEIWFGDVREPIY